MIVGARALFGHASWYLVNCQHVKTLNSRGPGSTKLGDVGCDVSRTWLGGDSRGSGVVQVADVHIYHSPLHDRQKK
jgi:hypothetical protein